MLPHTFLLFPDRLPVCRNADRIHSKVTVDFPDTVADTVRERMRILLGNGLQVVELQQIIQVFIELFMIGNIYGA